MDQPSAEAAANRAATIQRQLDRQEFHCSLIAPNRLRVIWR